MGVYPVSLEVVPEIKVVHIPVNGVPDRSTELTVTVTCVVSLLIVVEAVFDVELVPATLIADTL